MANTNGGNSSWGDVLEAIPIVSDAADWLFGDNSGAASKKQIAAGREAQQQYQGYLDKATGYMQPYYDRGTQAYGRLGDMVQSGAYDMQPQEYVAPQEQSYGQYNTPQFNFEADPGYQWRMQQGMNAVENSAAARGSQLSGATMKALAKYGQGLASDEYNNAYGRYQDQRNFGYNQYLNNRDFLRNKYTTDRQFGYNNFTDSYNRRNDEMAARYGRQAALAQTGYGAAGSLANMYNQGGQYLSDLTTQIGNAQAAGEMGKGAVQRVGGWLGDRFKNFTKPSKWRL